MSSKCTFTFLWKQVLIVSLIMFVYVLWITDMVQIGGKYHSDIKLQESIAMVKDSGIYVVSDATDIKLLNQKIESLRNNVDINNIIKLNDARKERIISLEDKVEQLENSILALKFLYEYYDTINVTSFRSKYIINNSSWYKYRLGDMFQSVFRRDDGKSNYSYHKYAFPDSIAVEYMDKARYIESNYSLLIEILDNRTKLFMDKDILNELDETLVVHLRTGDVIENTPYTPYQILTSNFPIFTKEISKRLNKYVRDLMWYEWKIKQISKFKNLKKALIITGFHKGTEFERSIKYIALITKLFEFNGFNISLRINKNPDNDFIIMCNSKYFLKSGGGFSNVIYRIVQEKGGQTFS